MYVDACNTYINSSCAVGGAPSSFAIRSKAAVLLALVTKRQGGELLQALLPELLRLAADGPAQTEMVRPAALPAVHASQELPCMPVLVKQALARPCPPDSIAI